MKSRPDSGVNGTGPEPLLQSPLEALLKHAADELIPLSALFEVTYTCNLKCIHCYRAGMSREGALPLGAITKILDQLSDAGVMFITFTGGEPFLRPDFGKILTETHKRKFVIRIFTNGTMIGDDEVDLLLESNVAGVDVSIYGASHEIHDKVTMIPGSWLKTVSAVEKMVKAGLSVNIRTTVMNINVEETGRISELAGRMGAGFIPNAVISPPTVDAGLAPGSSATKKDKPVYSGSVEMPDPALLDKLFREVPGSIPLHGRNLGLDSYPCNAGRSSFSIDPRGRLFPCPIFPEPIGTLPEDDFISVWRESPMLAEIRGWRMRDFHPCDTCPLLPVCNPCPALNYLERGDFLDAGGTICRLTGKLNCAGE